MRLLPPKKYLPKEGGPDDVSVPLTALLFSGVDEHASPVFHRHLKGQLLIPLFGETHCRVLGGAWVVPPRCGVWIPSGVLHRSFLSSHGQICMLFVNPETAPMPERCCSLPLSALIVEMSLHLARLNPAELGEEHHRRFVAVLLEQLAQVRPDQHFLPVPDDERLREVAEALLGNPADRTPVSEWARKLALSERSFNRLVNDKLGMSFVVWRRQIQLIAAQRWLVERRSVQRIASDLGYESTSAFIAMFRKSTGQSPARFLERSALVA
ncbi:MAG: AraC family transcriptional regulator [Burkholderiaceae bacterium]